MCSTILAGPDETITKKINETIMNGTSINRSQNCSNFETVSAPNTIRNLCDKLLEKIDMTSLRKAGTFLAEPRCKIFLSGFNENQIGLLRRCLKSAGALIMNQLTKSVTHVIVNGIMLQDHIKLVRTLDLNPHYVGVQWLIESMHMGMAVPESDFTVAISSAQHKNLSLLPKSNLTNPSGPPRKSAKQNDEIHVDNHDKNPEALYANAEDQIEDDIMAQYRAPTANPTITLKADKIENDEGDDDANNDTTTSFKLPKHTRTDAFSGANMSSDENISECSNKENGSHCTIQNGESDLDECHPRKDHHTLGKKFLTHKKILVSGFDQESCIELSQWISEAGGQIVQHEFEEVLDYVIVPPNPKISTCPNLRTKNIVSNFWIEDCLEQGKILDVEYFHKAINYNNGNKPCDGIVIGITGYSGKERSFIIMIAEELGMTAQDVFAKREKRGALRSTHLICASPDGAKYDAGVKWSLPVIGKDWVLACLRDNTWVSEQPFLIGKATVFTAGKISPKSDSPSRICPSSLKDDTSLYLNPSFFHASEVTLNVAKNKDTDKGKDYGSPISTTTFKSCAMETPIVRDISIKKLKPNPVEFVLTPSTDETLSRLQLESQPSPANMKRKREEENKQPTPFILRNVKTPETPYGAFLGKNPSKETRKFWKLQCDELGRFERTSEQKAQLAAKNESAAQYAKERQNERDKMSLDKEYEDYFKDALDPQKTQEMHLKTFKKCGVPILQPGGKTFDELMEEKMLRQGLSWKKTKRFRLSFHSKDSSPTEGDNDNNKSSHSDPIRSDTESTGAAAELSVHLAKFEELAQINQLKHAELKNSDSKERPSFEDKCSKDVSSKRRSSMKMILSSIEIPPDGSDDIIETNCIFNENRDLAVNEQERKNESDIRWVNQKEEEERKLLAARLSLENQDILEAKHTPEQKVGVFNNIYSISVLTLRLINNEGNLNIVLIPLRLLIQWTCQKILQKNLTKRMMLLPVHQSLNMGI